MGIFAMTYNITPSQQLFENLDLQASVWANKILSRKITNQQCKLEIWQSFPEHEIFDMQARVRKYLNAGLVTEATFKTPAQEQIERIKQQAKAPPAQAQSTTGSSDGLWSTNIRGKR
ncbi:MAG: hypothetical protein ACJASL_000137 [Paraglaciecola sp.]|jgi:hypothetical protein